MASTWKFGQIMSQASQVVPRGTEPQTQAIAANVALYKVWMGFDWRETMGDLPPFWLAPFRQDYGPPAVSVPSDFYGMRRAYCYDMNAAGESPYSRELGCPADLPVSNQTECRFPEAICYYEPSRKLRVHPLPGGNAAQYIVDGKYKKRVKVLLESTGSSITKVTAGQLNDALLPLDDMYMQIWLEAFRWALLSGAGDRAAGGVQMQNGRVGYVGQYAVLMAAIKEFSNYEGEELGNPMMHPTQPLVPSWGLGW